MTIAYTLSHNTARELDEIVNYWIKDGMWKLNGGPYADNGRHYQQIVKETET